MNCETIIPMNSIKPFMIIYFKEGQIMDSKYMEVKRENMQQVYFDVCDLVRGELPMNEDSMTSALETIKEMLEEMGV